MTTQKTDKTVYMTVGFMTDNMTHPSVERIELPLEGFVVAYHERLKEYERAMNTDYVIYFHSKFDSDGDIRFVTYIYSRPECWEPLKEKYGMIDVKDNNLYRVNGKLWAQWFGIDLPSLSAL